MYLLGISAFYHDSAACLLKDGQIVAAAEEERFTRVKHDNRFPWTAIKFCLENAGLKPEEIGAICYYEKPLLKFERLLETLVETYPASFRPFLKAMPEWLGEKIKIEYFIKNKLGFSGKIYFVPHHLSHAAAAYYPSPFKKAAVLTIDGVGEYQTTGLWLAEGQTITPLKQIDFPHSLGLLYSTLTAFLGFKVNEDEYKVMGLAAYGRPTYLGQLQKLVDLKSDGSFKLDLKYFGFRTEFRMWSRHLEELLGPPRSPEKPITVREKNLAASLQALTEKIYFKILDHLFSLTRTKNLCLSGGVALNALANGKIYHQTPFRHIFNFGPAGDSGCAVGAALFTFYQLLNGKQRSGIKTLSWGTSYSDGEIAVELKRHNLKYQKFTDRKVLVRRAAALLEKNKVLGWYQGKMELGPRALGNRSILANPQPRWMKDRVNEIKVRELFRPFAGSVLQENAHGLFVVPEKNHWSPFMNFCFQVKPERKKDIAAIIHADGSCRVQTVSKSDGLYYRLIKEFYLLTGVPCVLNTSFNLKGEPIVESPAQAITDFLKTRMDYLAIGNYLVAKVGHQSSLV